jgi:hypothetical protein
MALKAKKEGQKTILPIIQMIVLAEFVVFILSVFRRIWLYQELHGWSLVRIYGGIFLIFILGISITLALRHFVHKRWVMIEAALGLSLFIFVGFFNAEGFILNSNHLPTVNKRVDYVYLSRMSPDGYQGWKMAYDHAHNVLIDTGYPTVQLIDKNARREMAYSRMITRNLLENYHEMIKQYGTKEEIVTYYKKVLTHYDNQVLKTIELNQKNEGWRKDLENQHKEIEKIIKDLDKKDVDMSKLRNLVTMNYEYPGYMDNLYNSDMRYVGALYNVNYYEYFADRNMYYRDPSSSNTTIPYSSYDRFLTMNIASEQAWNTMKQDIPFDELLKMSEQFYTYFDRIVLQPENERNFEKDISVDSPLLDL